MESTRTAAQPEVVSALHQALRAMRAATVDAGTWDALGSADLVAAVEMAGALSRLVDTVLVTASAAVEQQCRLAAPGESVAEQHGLRDAAALLMTLTGASRRTLKRWKQAGGCTMSRGVGSTGELPPLLPQLGAAFSEGLVSLDQTLVIRQHLLAAGPRATADDMEAAEAALVSSATGNAQHLPLSPELLAVQAKAWRDAIDPDGVEPSFETQRQARSFTLGRRTDGMWVGKLLLPPEEGVALRIALDAHNAPRAAERYTSRGGAGLGTSASTNAATEARTDTFMGADPEPSAGTGVGAEPSAGKGTGTGTGTGSAAQESCSASGGAMNWLAETPPGAGLNRRGKRDDRTTAQRQADTLVGLITSAMAAPEAPSIGGAPATVVVTIAQDQLDEHAATGAGAAQLEHTGEIVPAHVAARLMCDGYLQACVLGEDGLPLKLGRARRRHTPHQRRAILTAYPGGCQNEGCEAPPGFTEIHHPIWWSAGGETDTENGVPLCPHCHALVHTGHLACVLDATGRWQVVPTVPLHPRIARGAA